MVLRSVRRPLLSLTLCVTAAAAGAQRHTLTLEDIYSYDGWRRLNGSQAAMMSWVPAAGPWLDDTHYLWPGRSDGKDADDSPWLRVDAATGSSSTLYAVDRLERALVNAGQDLYAFNIETHAATRLTASDGAKTEVTFSPDGRSVAFIKNNNLFTASTSTTGERALTSDGNAQILNGTLDWVYSEELYGRGNHRGYWWSPDSSRIAFLQLDERAVPEAALIDQIDNRPAVVRWSYPKSGDPNPIARLGVTSADAGSVRWIDTSSYADFLIVSVAWSADGRDVMYQIQDRAQTWLDLNRADASTGAPRRVLRETSRAWVERWQDASVDPIWLKDGSF